MKEVESLIEESKKAIADHLSSGSEKSDNDDDEESSERNNQ
jgi:hypothetical protein